MVSLLSALCALLVITEGPWPLVISIGAVLVAAHVLANLIGTRLRDTSAEVIKWRAGNPALGPDDPMAHTEPVEIAKLGLPPSTPLADHGKVGGRWLMWFVVSGALLGAVFGGVTILLTIGPQIGWPGWVVATLSCTVLGTWAAFLASSFSSIARHAWRHASEDR